jgi:glycine/D-amino acid oxidase-like deaminating enzyme
MLLAPITGEIISSLIFKEKPAIKIDPFLPERVLQIT